jgi:hypothetical protein
VARPLGFASLDRLPLRQSFLRRRNRRVAEHVGMAAHHLRHEALQHVAHRELAGLLGQARVEDHLEEQIAEFFL